MEKQDTPNKSHIENKDMLILIVDDISTNLQVLGTTLRNRGYQVMPATSGKMALKMLDQKKPDLILLDIMMPEMDGYEVCTHIKEQEAYKDIPVIFITGKTEPDDIVKGFEVGGIDYVTKPFESRELLSRVHSHLELKIAKELLSCQNSELIQLNEEKNHFIAMASHDLKNPLSIMLLGCDILLANKKASVEDFKTQLEKQRKMVDRMLGLITRLLNVNSIEEKKFIMHSKPFSLKKLASNIIEEYSPRIKEKKISAEFVQKCKNPEVKFDENATRQIIENLFSNALKFSKEKTKVELILTDHEKSVRLSIKDQGPGFSPEDEKKIFGKFAKLSARPTGGESSSGLGLSIVKMLVESMGCQISYETKHHKGTSFHIDFPKK